MAKGSSSSSENDHLGLLFKANSILNSTETLEQILETLIQEVIATLGAERGFVVLREDQSWRTVAAHYKSPEQRIAATRFSQTLVTKVCESGQPLLTLDALEEQNPPSPSIVMHNIRSVVCVPLLWEGRIQGVVYADNSVKAGAFTTRDLQILEAIAGHASKTLEAAALHQKLKLLYQGHLEQARQSSALTASSNDGLGTWEGQAGSKTLDTLLSLLEGSSTPSEPQLPAAPSKPLQTAKPKQPKSCTPRIYLFGSLRVRCGEELRQDWPVRKDRELLAYLSAHLGRVVHEDLLTELFWSKGGPRARHSLQNSITQIRKMLDDSNRELLQRKLDGYTLNQACWVDTDEFSRCCREGTLARQQGDWDTAIAALSKADNLATGEFLEGLHGDWIDPIRHRLQEELVLCRIHLAEYFQDRGRHALSIELWKRVLHQDNCSEVAYRGLLQAYRALGRRADAVRTFQECKKAFHEELDLAPPADFEELIIFE